MTLRVQLLTLQTVIVLFIILGTGWVAVALSERQLRQAYVDRMLGTAQSVAQLPAIIDAFDDTDPAAAIQPIAEVIRKASGMTYVVVTNREGIRYSHPKPENIGERVSTDPSVPLSGETFIGTETGTMGESWRAKVPVFDADGTTVIGTVSVGILETELNGDLRDDLLWLILALGIAAVVGVLGSAWITGHLRRRIHGLEPEDIETMLRERDGVLHGIREGLVGVDDRGVIRLVNDAARELLLAPADPLGTDERLLGRPVAEVLDAELVAAIRERDGRERLVLLGERRVLIRATPSASQTAGIGAVLTLRDHTELHALLHELDGANTLAEGLRAQAHEFSNRLHVISGLLELGEGDAAVDYIARNGSGGSLAGGVSSGALHDLEVAALVLARQVRAREVGITMTVTEGSDLAPLTADAALRDDVLTVVGNLLGNSVEACSPGAHVRLSLSGDPAGVTICVEDSGPGLPEPLGGRIFDTGVSTKERTASTGRGIGLALVLRIAERRGGRIDTGTSDLGGARLTVTLPGGTP